MNFVLIGSAFFLCVLFSWLVTWILPVKVYDSMKGFGQLIGFLLFVVPSVIWNALFGKTDQESYIECHGGRFVPEAKMDPLMVELLAGINDLLGHPFVLSVKKKALLKMARDYLPELPSEEVVKMKAHYVAPEEGMQ